MGIFDFVKQGVQEMLIQRPDQHKELIVYKHPENTIPHWSQLTVDADEAAVFFRDGAVVGTLRTAGVGQRHTLSAGNIPFLGRLIDQVTGGNIWITDLYFVTMKPIFNVRFGDTLGYMEDPMLGEMVTPRIYGDMAIQVINPERFIVGYVGMHQPSGNAEVTKWITKTFMNSVTTVVGEVCVNQQMSLLQLMPMQNQLSQMFLQRAPSLDEIGVKIVQMGQFRINLSAEDEETLKGAQAEIGKAKRQARIANIGIAEAQAKAQQKQFELDQQFSQDSRYVQNLAGGNFGGYAAGKAMMGAGQGMAQGGGGEGGGGGMLQGAGIGAGFAMAQAMQQGMQGGPQQQRPAAPQAGGTVACPGCQKTVAAGKFCVECGATLAPQPRFCPSCGTQGIPASKFCANCGTSFGT